MQSPPNAYAHKWWIMLAVSLTLLMGTMDGTIVNVALPTLVRDFQTDLPTIQWVVLAFLVGLSTLMLSVGRLADMVGKKRIFAIGLAIFVLGSALCGLSPTVYALIAFRFLQSIGAAMTVALGVAIVTETWPPQERGKAIGISAGVISLGIVIGPSAGGLIIAALNWRWIFFVNIPLGLLALFLVLRFIPSLKPKANGETFDFPGAAIVGGGLLALSLALTVGQKRGFSDPLILALLAIFAIAVVAFILVERRARYPMIDLDLFRNPQFSLNLVTGFMTFVAIAAVVFLMPFYLELVLGLPVLQVGLLIAVVPVVLTVLGPLSGSLSDRYGTRPVSVLGLVFLLIGYLALSTLSVTTSPLGYVLRMLPVGIGMGTFQIPNNSAIMGTAPRSRYGIASGMLSMTRTLGQTTGIALMGALFSSLLVHHEGRVVTLTEASTTGLTQALNDLLFLVAAMIAVALALALWAWWREGRAARR